MWNVLNAISTIFWSFSIKHQLSIKQLPTFRRSEFNQWGSLIKENVIYKGQLITNFMSLVSLYTPRQHQKTIDFLMFSGI